MRKKLKKTLQGISEDLMFETNHKSSELNLEDYNIDNSDNENSDGEGMQRWWPVKEAWGVAADSKKDAEEGVTSYQGLCNNPVRSYFDLDDVTPPQHKKSAAAFKRDGYVEDL